MADIASLVLGIPSYIEGFVKVGRTILKYKSLASNHIKTVEDAIFCAGTLQYYARFVNVKDPESLNHPSRLLLEEALGHASDALDTARGILHSWTLHLNPDTKPLLSGPAQHSLNSRLEFRVKLGTSVLIVHSLGLVHKNICPESILVTNILRSGLLPRQLGTPYLISFGQARLSAGPSDLTSYVGAALARTLYVHPRHTSSTKRKKFQMRDDIYSLGICFLEIAIWKSLFKWDAEKGGFVCDFSLLKFSDDHYEHVLRSRGRSIHHDKCWIRRYDIIDFAANCILRMVEQLLNGLHVSGPVYFSRYKIELYMLLDAVKMVHWLAACQLDVPVYLELMIMRFLASENARSP